MKIQTVLGPIDDSELGRTLIHEHILIKFPGAEFDPKANFDRAGLVREGTRRLKELREAHGVRTFVDPCPVEMGRDVTIMKEISEGSGVNIVCTTGFYFEAMGLPPFWKHSSVEQIAEFYCTEIEEGIMDTGIRAGAIKCATGSGGITDAEKRCLAAAAIAQKKTGVPIITHTQGGLGGPEQQDQFSEHGVYLRNTLIGHCCESSDRAYHQGIVKRGSYIGFDRIGWAQFQSDDVRADCLVDLFNAGHGAHILMSQDRICGMYGRFGRKQTEEEIQRMEEALRRNDWPPAFTHLFTSFIPKLVARGMSEADAYRLLDDNPTRFFRGDPLPPPAPRVAAADTAAG